MANPPAPGEAAHPFDFQVHGPHNLPSPSWRDLVFSSWKNPDYRRIAMACLIQAVYLLEVDRQERRSGEACLAPRWWRPFKYRLSQTLTDSRDGSIYGAVFEWDGLVRPGGAPKAVLALRGTLLRAPTIRRDVEDDLRFLAWESLKGSVRFAGALEALRAVAVRHGGGGVWVGGHSLGAGFALQVGKALAKQGIFVECHVFNPPSMSVAASIQSFGETASGLWKMVRSRLPYAAADPAAPVQSPAARWMPHLYINTSDYICCFYKDRTGTAAEAEGDGERPPAPAKMFVASKGPRSFLEAHGLQQWWSDDVELQAALSQSSLINRQLRSLYTPAPATTN